MLRKMSFTGMTTLFLFTLTLGLTGCHRLQQVSEGTFSWNEKPAAQVTVFFSKSRGPKTVVEGVVRDLPQEAQPLDYALKELLQGPNEKESTQGFFSEIPKGTRLIGIERGKGRIEVNLSQQFTSGGGSNSMEQRLEELTNTIQTAEKKEPVYVEIEGKPLQVLGGEGVMVQEPVNQPSAKELR